MSILKDFENNQIKEISKDKLHPTFYAGDTLKIHLKIKEGEKERIQIFEGICIAIKNAGINSAFTTRKISYGEGVERVFPYYSPNIQKIELVKSGSVRRSKLYFLRGRSGKSARISEKNKFVKTKIINKKINKDTSVNKIEKNSESKVNKDQDKIKNDSAQKDKS
tara:strand:- start:314 stop:808 length:495 start_codon:yes stop_codon:yes gene_type:complete